MFITTDMWLRFINIKIQSRLETRQKQPFLEKKITNDVLLMGAFVQETPLHTFSREHD